MTASLPDTDPGPRGFAIGGVVAGGIGVVGGVAYRAIMTYRAALDASVLL